MFGLLIFICVSIIVYLAIGSVGNGPKKAFAGNSSICGRDSSEDLTTENAAPAAGEDIVQCRACGHAIHKKAKPCPNCGCPDPVEKGLSVLQAFLLFMCLSVFCVFGISCLGIMSNDSVRSSSATHRRRAPTLAEMMAVIDNGYDDKAGSSLVDIKLRRLSKKYPEREDQIAAMTLRGQKMLAEKGIHMSLIEILSAIDSSSPQETPGMTYAEALAAFVTLRGS